MHPLPSLRLSFVILNLATYAKHVSWEHIDGKFVDSDEAGVG